jgi:hypothetical protein
MEKIALKKERERISRKNSLFAEGPLQQPTDNREVLPLVVGWEDNRVFALNGAHLDCSNEEVNETRIEGRAEVAQSPSAIDDGELCRGTCG